MKFEEIEQLVIKWAEDRAIFTQSTAQDQFEKLLEELIELGESIDVTLTEGNPYSKEFLTGKPNIVNRNDAIDAIGDMMVVQTIIAQMIGTDLLDCYKAAYDQIKDRRGRMINGIFVKES